MKWLTPHFLPLGLVILSVWLNFYHQGKYQQKAKDYDDLNTKYQTQVIAIKDQQERIKHFAELDTKYIQELAHAKSKITQLSDDLRTNVKRVHVKAQCPVSETASPPAWMVQDPPDWRKTLNKIMYVSSENWKSSKPSISD